MAIITVQTIEHLLTPDEKRQIIAQITDVMVAVKGDTFRRLTWVRIEEIPEGNLGVGGVRIYARDFARIRQGADRTGVSNGAQASHLPQ